MAFRLFSCSSGIVLESYLPSFCFLGFLFQATLRVGLFPLLSLFALVPLLSPPALCLSSHFISGIWGTCVVPWCAASLVVCSRNLSISDLLHSLSLENESETSFLLVQSSDSRCIYSFFNLMLIGVVYYFFQLYILVSLCSSISWCLQLFVVFPKMLSHQQKMLCLLCLIQ